MISELMCQVINLETIYNNDILILRNKDPVSAKICEIIESKSIDADLILSENGYYCLQSPKQQKLEDSQDFSENESGNTEGFLEIKAYKEDEGSYSDLQESLVLLDADDQTNYSSPEGSEDENQSDQEICVQIEIKELVDEQFDDRNMLNTKIKEWAIKNKMSLSFKTAEIQRLKDKVSVSTLYCSKKGSRNCKFYLEFTKKEGAKYSLAKYYNHHNHELNIYNSATEITKEILELIIKLQPLHTDAPGITKIVNKQFEKNFSYRTIYYQLKKLKNLEYGEMNEDAKNFIEMLQNDAKTRNGFYNFLSDEKNKLLNCCYMSSRMHRNLAKFKDVLIIDSTHKSNRFGMPLLDVVVVNNLGHTITCFISLLQNQKYDSFHWALSNLKNQLKGEPVVIFSDDEEALCQGILI